MKIYTKTGDDGTTGLFAGDRVAKDHPRIRAYGTVDELNSFLGLAFLRVDNKLSPRLKEILIRLQNELFVLGGDLATPGEAKYPVPRIENNHVSKLENDIDELESGLEPFKTVYTARRDSSCKLPASCSDCLQKSREGSHISRSS